MPEGWQETTLGEVANWFAGGTPKASNPAFYTGGQIPWAVIADLLNDPVIETAKQINEDGLDAIGGRLAPVGSILVSMYGTIARTAIAGVPLATNQAIAWAEPHQDTCDGGFLRLLIDRLQPAFESAARGAAQKNINRGMIKDARILLPPSEEQRRIVDLVGSIDSYIDRLEAQIRLATSARQGVLLESMSNRADGWLTCPLSELALLIKRGRAPSYADDGILVLNQKCVRPGNRIDYSVARRTDPTVKAIPDWAFLQDGDVLVNSTGSGTAGRAALATNVPERATVDSHITIVRAKPDLVDPAIIGMFLSSMPKALEQLATGSTSQVELSRDSIGQILLSLPPLPEQRRIVDLIGSFDQQISSLDSQVESTRALRSGVLSELLSGERLLDESYDIAVGL